MRIETRYGVRRQSEAGRPLFARARRCAAERGADGASAPSLPSRARGFTLIELILVMALLVIAVSFVTPHLQGFFRGRTMQSEARQIIAMMHDGQSRAVSAGVPTTLWFDAEHKKYGLEEEPGYTDKDPNAVEIPLNENLRIEIPQDDPSANQPASSDLSTPHSGLPKITFLPDGTIAETSPKTIRIVDSEGPVLLLTQTRDRNEYEIATTTDQQ